MSHRIELLFATKPKASSSSYPNPAASPLLQKERIVIIDSMRGIALLGILMMNIPYFGMSEQFGFNLNLRSEYSGANYYTWWIVNGFFEGTMRGWFSLLFGAGSLLLLSRLEKKDTGLTAADFYYRRLIWLLIFGIINAFVFLWPGDILYSYAICGLFLYPFRILKPKHLFALGISILLVGTVKQTLRMYEARDTRVAGEKALQTEKQGHTLSEQQLKEKEKWVAFRDKHSTAGLLKDAAKQTKEMKKGYLGIMTYLKDVNIENESLKFYNSYFWDIIALFFIGMAFYKWGILTGERSPKFYWLLMIGGYGIGLPVCFWMLQAFVAARFDATRIADLIGVNFYQERRLLVLLGHIGLIMLLYKYQFAGWLLKIMSRVGQMAFSNYLMQSIFCVTIFYGFGFRLFGELQRYQLYLVVASIWIFQVLFSNLWLHYFRFGPFEWVWRSLTYWKPQPMRRHSQQIKEMVLA